MEQLNYLYFVTVNSLFLLYTLLMNDSYLIAIILFIAGFVESFLGFGSALLAMPFLTILLGVRTATPLFAFVTLPVSLVVFFQMKKHFQLKRLLYLIIGSLIGIPLGIFFIKYIDEKIAGKILACLLIGYSLYSLTFQEIVFELGTMGKLIFSTFIGFINGAFNLTGPLLVIYSNSRNWSNNQMKNALASYFIITAVFRIIFNTIFGLMTEAVVKIFVYSLPVLVISALLGGYLYSKLHQQVFKKIVYLFILLSGIFLLIR